MLMSRRDFGKLAVAVCSAFVCWHRSPTRKTRASNRIECPVIRKPHLSANGMAEERTLPSWNCICAKGEQIKELLRRGSAQTSTADVLITKLRHTHVVG